MGERGSWEEEKKSVQISRRVSEKSGGKSGQVRKDEKGVEGEKIELRYGLRIKKEKEEEHGKSYFTMGINIFWMENKLATR